MDSGGGRPTYINLYCRKTFVQLCETGEYSNTSTLWPVALASVSYKCGRSLIYLLLYASISHSNHDAKESN